jgi:hypothetical protein
MRRYNIIWIDDLYDKQEAFCILAELKGFVLIPFRTSCEGMLYLRNNLHDIDAVILDARVFRDTVEEAPTTGGLSASLAELAKISGQHNLRDIPHVIFTGEPDLIGNDVFEQMTNGVEIFRKLESNDALFDKLKVLIGDSQNSTLRNRYPAVYDACVADDVGRECWVRLYPILAFMNSGKQSLSDPYNDIRQVLEFVFRMLYRKGILHERLIENDAVNLNGSSRFLAAGGCDLRDGTKVNCKTPVFPKLFADEVRFILNVTQLGSHTEDAGDNKSGRPSIKEVEKYVLNHHLLEVVTLMTLDLIVWARVYVDENPNPIENMKNWEVSSLAAASESGKGVVLKPDLAGNYFVKLDDRKATGGGNVRIRKRLIKGGGLIVDSRVCVKYKNVGEDRWDAESYEQL